MKLYSGKRIGQSTQELGTAVSFSLFIHVVLFLAALLLYTVTPRTFMPPSYSVKLVGMPAEKAVPLQAPSGLQPEAEKQPKKTQQKKSTERSRPAEKNNDLPDLASIKPKPQKAGTEDAELPIEKKAPVSAQAGAGAEASGEGVSVGTSQQDFKYAWYLARVRDKISRNWKAPEDTKDARCRVIFSINRSGWVGAVVPVDEHSTGRFEFKQAAIRAIHASNPFPPLPEEFSKQTLEFTVDLMAKK